MCLGPDPAMLEGRGRVRDWEQVSPDNDICRLGLCERQDGA